MLLYCDGELNVKMASRVHPNETCVVEINNKDFKIGSLRTTDYGSTRRGPGSRFTAHAR